MATATTPEVTMCREKMNGQPCSKPVQHNTEPRDPYSDRRHTTIVPASYVKEVAWFTGPLFDSPAWCWGCMDEEPGDGQRCGECNHLQSKTGNVTCEECAHDR